MLRGGGGFIRPLATLAYSQNALALKYLYALNSFNSLKAMSPYK